MPSLLSFLDPQHSWATQTSAGDFMKAIITVSANASQNEQTCIGPNELTRQLVSKPCVEQLIKYMLGGGNALTVGVGIVIEVIRKNNSDYDPDVGAEANSVPSSRDPIYLGTLLRLFAENVPNFMNLIMNAPAQKARLDSTFGEKIEPLGFDRFKTCELMAELLHCSNMGLLNEVGSEELIAVRDEERRRLRLEGKLTSVRGDDIEAHVAADDLTMRISHSSPADEGRRLEITNVSDDDGFEEVSHAADMSEDTSHEFVNAEDEIAAVLPTSSLLGKDEDDFVEEPLSSPRLHVRDDKLEDAHFDEPDLLVAPLSPRKQKPAVTEEKEDSSQEHLEEEGSKTTDDAIEKIDVPTEEEQAPAESDEPEPEKEDLDQEKSEESESSIIFMPTITSLTGSVDIKPEANTATEESEHGQSAPVAEDLSPHPEDAPAPLFSKDAADSAPVETPNELENLGNEAPESKDETEPVKSTPEPEEACIIVGHQIEAPHPSDINPVVGDFLKMQFVEHRVVPTILVGLSNPRNPADPLLNHSDPLLVFFLRLPLEQLPPQRCL